MDTEQQLNQFEEEMSAAMTLARKRFRTELRSSISDSELSHNEVELLLFLSNHPVMNTAKEMARCKGISRSLVSKSVDLLLKKGYISAAQDQEDRRKIHLSLEPKAGELVERLQAARQDFIKRIFQGLSQEELTFLSSILQKIRSNLMNPKNETEDH